VEGGADSLGFEVLGEAATWSWVVPPAEPVSNGEVVARVVTRPPKASSPVAGTSALRVRVRVKGDAGAEAEAEASLTIAPFADLHASLSPVVAEGRVVGDYELTVENRGNSPSTVAVSTDGDTTLSVQPGSQSFLAPAGQASRVKVRVRSRRRVLRGQPVVRRFQLNLRAGTNPPVRVAGELHQRAVLAGRTPAFVLAVVAVVIVGGLGARMASSSGSSGSSPAAARVTTLPAATAAASGCPVTGHKDTFVSGLTPDRIPSLPASHSFSFASGDGCTPVRFDPCQAVHYVVNPSLAPPTGMADVREAFLRVAAATGVTFVDDGTTDEVSRRGPFIPDRYPDRWAPILVLWFRQPGTSAGIEVVGSGLPNRVQDAFVSGTLRLNADAIVDVAKKTPLPGGFGSGGGSGVGAIGAEGVTWGRVILHEIAHIMGLGHTRDRDQLMYPDTAEQTSHTTDFRSGDREGLRVLGQASGCMASPPVPGPAR